MKHLNFFKSFDNKTSFPTESKGYLYNSFLDLSYSAGYSIDITLALSYYATVSVVATAIDIICKEYENITPVIRDNKKEEFISDDPILELINNPNADETGTEFRGKYSRDFKTTGNTFILATGNVNRPPLELSVIKPNKIAIQKSSEDQFPLSYTYSSDNVNVVFKRVEEKGRFRFINSAQDMELRHIRKFNPYDSLWGLSELNAVYLEINQYFQSNQHNLNMLRKGIRSSGILSYDGELTSDQRDSIRSQINSDNAGSNNTGSIFVFDGSKMDFKELSQSMKDMDFKDLKRDIGNTIYTRLEIPLPLVSTENQKYDNMFQAKLGLYDEAVIPMTNYLDHELTLFLMPRYKRDPNQFSITYNIFSVPVLRERELLNVERLKKVNILTTNELRAMIAKDDVSGGDVIYQPFNLVPLGTEPQQQTESTKTLKLKQELKKIRYANGDDVYVLGD